MTQTSQPNLQHLLNARYSDAPTLNTSETASRLIASMLSRGSCREFHDKPVPAEVLDVLCATALAAPTKSDLQQRDIILLNDPGLRARLASLVSGQAWVADAPMIAVFCGNNRRHRLLHDWHGVAFANDHLDAFFNAACDAAIAMGAFVTAAEALGLGCCPISAVRNEARAVSDMLDLPQHVFPFAGLAIGYPRKPAAISKRLPLKVTCHTDRYSEDCLEDAVRDYDADRAATQPYTSQRFEDEFGEKPDYAWSDDKVRQYSREERADFGEYIRARGFNLK